MRRGVYNVKASVTGGSMPPVLVFLMLNIGSCHLTIKRNGFATDSIVLK